MQNTAVTLPEPRTEAEYQAAIDQMLTEMERLNRQMESDRKEIDRLKSETRALLVGLGVGV